MIIPDNRDEQGRYDDPEPCFGPAPSALLDGFLGRNDCELHIVCCSKKPLRSPAKIQKHIYYHSVVVPQWGWARGCYLGCVRAVRNKLKQIQPDIVHGQGSERYCALAAVFSGFPNVITIHGNMLGVSQALNARFGSYYWLAARLETFALSRTLGVFCNSAYTERLVAPRARRTWRVSNALAPAFFVPLPELKAAIHRPVIMNVGQVVSYKRQAELLALAEKLHAQGLRFEMQFVGDPAEQTAYGKEFLKRAGRGEQAGYARYLGVKTQEEVVAILDSAHAMVHFPSEEAFGLAAAEGLARNLKLFASRVGGMIDIASGIEAAELVETDDWSSLQSAIALWLESGAPMPSTAAHAMQGRYGSREIAEEHLRIYRDLLG